MSSPRRSAGRRPSRAEVERLSGRHVVEAAFAAKRRKLYRLLVKKDTSRDDIQPLIDRASELGLPIAALEGQALSELAGLGEVGFQGVVLEAGPLPVFSSIKDLLRARSGGERQWIVALDGVEDPRNLGAIARVAEAAGAAGILLTDRRSSRLGPIASRASAGAIEWLPICRVPNLPRALAALKKEGLWVVAADPAADSTLFELPDRLLSGELVVVLGAEGRGLRPSVRAAIDHPVRIPMLGRVESLNVSTAAAIILYDLVRRAECAAGPSGP